ncbi:hypothetical protein Kpol_1048p33 [Vanderwaltozyma polyspora DSM 70294]|uniref:Uncharacterized protein n=1 Tax=Vanderwaltozyma polyspora (strain ATCC 22028 / DSM 70294 / BCRC 21397 / CBS 2163 / NBRC 10782 / NRRL Y-8283 / UCD 57-17) TaxID=436907 RepID=A7TGJ5_VANPO|nr:uncharacterized protein Kpol_1048p33 [Vanderwaltozyma polyspora DSM 70294]EDO18602.1 hypothetical protein Kpol_1048p33 [Vanderwaltozyma polyspora DSM 70294]
MEIQDQENIGKKGFNKDNAITKPIALDQATGEVQVRKSTGKVKIRKGQSEEEYEKQLDHFFNIEKGPTVTEVNWMDNQDALNLLNTNDEYDITIKQTRQKLTSFCERYYYQRRYEECLTLSQKLLEIFEPLNTKNKMNRELDELRYMIDHCQKNSNHENVVILES